MRSEIGSHLILKPAQGKDVLEAIEKAAKQFKMDGAVEGGGRFDCRK